MSGLQILGVDNLMFGVGDFGQARDFYAGKLGLEVKFQFEELGLIGFRLGAEEPGLLCRVQEIAIGPARDSPRVWLEVADARAAGLALIESGLQPLTDPREINTGWVIEFADPWGNVFGLTDYTNAPEQARRR